MNGHTSGPWRVDSKSDPNRYVKSGTFYVAEVRDLVIMADGMIGSISPKEKEANAHLISVAPEMYELLNRCRDYVRRMEGGSPLHSEISRLMLKALGEK